MARAIDRATQYARDVLAGRYVAGPWVRLACERHLRELKAYGTRRSKTSPFWFDRDAAARVIEFFETELVLADMLDEDGDALPFTVQDWQAFILGSLFGWKKADGHRRFRTGYIETGKGSGKALALDTPIPTVAGWSTMGEIRAGDVLFDEHGQPTTVVGAFDTMHGHDCYRVTFDNGDSIVADADHLWLTEQRKASKRGESLATKGVPLAARGAWRRGIRTTRAIADTLRYANGAYQSANHSIPVAGALELPAASLPIDPYVLGVWLGDGDSDCARVTCGSADLDELSACLRAAGVTVGTPQPTGTAFRVRIGSDSPRRADSLQAALRRAGLLRNKHVPPAYLRASVAQRRALLQGLMDTDGWISAAGSACEFSGMSRRLVEDVAALACSLGLKSFVTSKEAKIDGRVVGVAWAARFTAPAWPIFRLQRKVARQACRHERRKLSADHRIVSCEPVASVPVRCIAVDSPSRLFLAGRSLVPTHNTPLGAGIALYCLLADGQAFPEVYSAAVSQKQAAITWVDATRMVNTGPESLREQAKVSAHVITGTGAKGGKFEAISSEYRGLEGKRPHCAVIDEVHEHPNAQVVTKMRRGTKRNKDALILELTNSGYDRQSICYQHHEYSRRVLEQVVEGPNWFAYVCGLDEGDDYRDRKVWPKANPNIGITIDWSYLQEAVDEAQGMPESEADVMRLNFCVWVERQSNFIPSAVWQRGARPMPPDLSALTPQGGLDLGMSDDLSAFALVWRLDVERYFARVWYWVPRATVEKHPQRPWDQWRKSGHLTLTDGDVTDFTRVQDAVLDITRRYGCQSIAFDKRFAAQMAQNLQAEGLEMVDQMQGFALNEATRKLGTLLKAGGYGHDGDPVTTWQASNLVVTKGARGDIRPDKEKSGDKIDGMVAQIMALGRAMLVVDTPPVEPQIISLR